MNIISSQFNFRNIGFLMGAICYTLLIANESTRFPFILGLVGLFFFLFLFIRTNWMFLFLWITFFIPVSVDVGIILKPADFLLSFLFLLLVLNYFTSDGAKIRFGPYSAIFGLWILVALISLINAKSFSTGFSDVLQMIELYIIGGIVLASFLSDENSKKIALIIVVAITIQSLGAIPSLIQGKRFWGWMGGSFPIVASFAAIIAYHGILYFNGKQRLFSTLAFIFILLGLLGSATRSAWVALIGGIMVINYFTNPKLFKKSLVILLIVFLLIVFLGPDLVVTRLLSIGDPDFYSNVARVYLMMSAWHAFTEHPLLGVGIKNMSLQIADYLPESARFLSLARKHTIAKEIEHGSGTHNMYFAVLGELGLAGSILLMILLFKSIRQAKANLEKSVSKNQLMKNSCIFSCLIAFYILAFFVPGIHVRIEYTLYWVLLLVLIESEKENFSNPENNFSRKVS